MLSSESNEEHISKAVHAFIAQKTHELVVKKKYDPNLTEEVKKQLIAKANSTFLCSLSPEAYQTPNWSQFIPHL